VIGDAFVCSSCLGHSHGPQQPSQAAYGLLFSPISRTLVRQKALFRPKQAESSTSKTSLTCLVTMWRGSAGHDVRNPYSGEQEEVALVRGVGGEEQATAAGLEQGSRWRR